MKELKLFLKALEELRGDENFYVDKLTITPQKPMAAYKKYVLEIWAVDGTYKQCISNVQIIDKVTTETQDISMRERLTKETIKEILKYYGL